MSRRVKVVMRLDSKKRALCVRKLSRCLETKEVRERGEILRKFDDVT